MTTPTTWPAPTPAQRARRVHPRVERVRRAIIAVVGVGVVGAAVGVGRPFASSAAVVVVLTAGAATSRAAILPRSSRIVLAIGLLSFAPWLMLRSSPWLLVPDVIAALVVAGVALSMRNGAGAFDSAGGYLARFGGAIAGIAETPSHVHLGVRTAMPAEGRNVIMRSARPLLAGALVALAVAAVLASGDAVFASYVDLGTLPSSTARRFLGALAAMSATCAAVGVAIRSDCRPPIPERRFVTSRSSVIALAPIAAVYAAFVVVQLSTVVLGASYVETRTGLSYAEYARTGFFQLVVVASASLVGMVVLRPTVRTATLRSRRALISLVGVVAVSTIAMAAAAIVKLQLYADAFGLTMLRLHTTVFAAWLIVALVIVYVSLVKPTGEWVIAAVSLTALVGVFAMNVANPERIVAEHNLTTTIASDDFDIGYLTSLSDDAVPSIVAHLDRLEPRDRERAVRSLCDVTAPSNGGLDWNRARSVAGRARASIC